MLFMVKCFFLLIHFLVAEDHELPESTSHILSVPLNLECVRILSWSIAFSSYFNCFPDDVLCKIAFWVYYNDLNSLCDKPCDLSQKVVIWSWKYENAIPEISENSICIQVYIDMWEIIYLQAKPYRLKSKNINSLIFISTIIKWLMLVIFLFCFGLVFFKKEKKELVIYLCSSPQSYCLK